ncbi:MAG: flippase-like domain-containing protein [Cyanobacteria bacterium K_Offshore_0m_m2_072]|nr:flippase-like domain-containing protein [Cyanobacteria bacterium K_Offshore_0m_m2_072]
MKALVLLAGVLLVYGLLGLAIGWRGVGGELAALPAWLWLLAAGVALAGHGLLFARWQLLLIGLGHPLGARASGAIYIAGLGLIAAPARSGEALRGLWLQRRHQIPLRIGVAATAAERLFDLASALGVVAWGLGLAQQSAALFALLGTMAAVVGLLSHPRALMQLERSLNHMSMGKPWRGLHRVLWEAVQALRELRSLLKPMPLLWGLGLTTAVWLLESSLLELVFAQLRAAVSLEQAAVMRTATSLGGVLSLLPAGLGTSELTSVGLGVFYGANRSQALAATVVLRAVTLLLPALIGVIALVQQPDLQRLRRD